jgi:hypothetical protein
MTQTYTDMTKLYATKAKQYDKAQCKAAIADIDATLRLYYVEEKGHYVVKLWCERDAMLDRMMTQR